MTPACGLRDRPLVFVDDLARPELAGDDYHHLSRVLRVGDGQPIALGDGTGRWRPARFGAEPEPTGAIEVVERPAPPVTVAFTPVKGERADWVVQKLTELGVDEIVPVVAARSVVRWEGDRAAKQLQRMRRVAREACLQSRRLTLPVVAPLTDLTRLLATQPELVLADPEGPPLHAGARAVVIGPEGGFSADELATARTGSLPGNVLRAETAAIVAATVVCGYRDAFFEAHR